MDRNFPFDMYHIGYGAVTVNSESDVENCIRNGFKFDPPSKTNSAFIRAKIAEFKSEIAQLEINLEHALLEEEKKKDAQVETPETDDETPEKSETEKTTEEITEK